MRHVGGVNTKPANLPRPLVLHRKSRVQPGKEDTMAACAAAPIRVDGAALLSPSSRSQHPPPALLVRFPLCPCGPAASKGPGLASALCRGPSALCRVPRERPAVAGCPSRPCPILRPLRPARSPRASAVSGVVRSARCCGHTTPIGQARAPAPGKPGHGCGAGQPGWKTTPPCASRARLRLSRPARAVGWRKR